MGKMYLKPFFCLITFHPDDWKLLEIHWQSKFQFDLYLTLLLAWVASHISLINFVMHLSGF